MRYPIVILFAAPALFSCESSETADAFVAVDSAGITIVTNSGDGIATAPTWSLIEDSVLTHGLESANAPDFFQVTDILPLPDGRFAVLDAGNSEVLILDGSGTLVERFGKAGDGPGEFRRPNSLVPLPPDSVGVYDSSSNRLTVFEPAGTVARVAPIEGLPQTSGFERLFPLHDGQFAVFTWGGFSGDETEGVFRAEAECLRVSRNGEKIGSYGAFPGTQVFIGGGAMGSPLFAATTHVATSGNRLVVGTAESPEWRAYGPDGAPLRIVRWPDHEREVTQDRVDALVEALVSQLPQGQQTQMRVFFSQMPHAAEVPAYQDILASDEGEVWVGDYPDPAAQYLELPQPARRWMVFGNSGEVVATVETPTGFQPLSIGNDAVFGVFRDDMGVETPRKYQVVRN